MCEDTLSLRTCLSPEEVAELNRVMDSQDLPPPQDDTTSARFGGFLEWDKIFCDLLGP